MGPAAREQLLPQGAVRIGRAVTAAALQLRHDQIDERMQALRHDRAPQIEAIDARFIGPRDELIRHFSRIATCSSLYSSLFSSSLLSFSYSMLRSSCVFSSVVGSKSCFWIPANFSCSSL